jgi:hypothetical protein
VLPFYTGIGSVHLATMMMRLSADFRCITADPPDWLECARLARSDDVAQFPRAVTAVIQALDASRM